MPKRKQHSELSFAVCAESADERQMLRAYLARRKWNDTGREYAAGNLHELFSEAGRGTFNAAFMNVGGIRWFAQIVPDREFPQPEPKPKSKPENDAPPASAISEQDAAIIERAGAMMVEGPQSAEAIAEVLMREKLLKGNAEKAAKQVRRALLRSRAFCVSSPKDGELPTWRPWQPTTRSVDDPSGRRTIYTEVLSTTGVPVEIAIPLKPMAEIARILLQSVLADGGKSPHQVTNGTEPD